MSKTLVCMVCMAAWAVPVVASQADSNAPSEPNTPVVPLVTLDSVLKMWTAGQKEQSLKSFLVVDWSSPNLFAADSIFRISEAQFVRLPESKRAQIHQQAMDASKSIRELAKFAVEQAKQTGTQEKYHTVLLNCAKRLSGNDQLALIQMVAKAVAGYTEKELKPG